MTNQRVQTLTNEEIINSEVNEARVRFTQDKSKFMEEDSFPKPVMVYNNPHFKAHVPQTQLKKQKASKPARYLPNTKPEHASNFYKDSGSSYMDKARYRSYNPGTGDQLLDIKANINEGEQDKINGDQAFSYASFGPQTKVIKRNSNLGGELERAKEVLDRGSYELRQNLTPKEGSFNTDFKNFFDSKIKPSLPPPGTPGQMNNLGKVTIQRPPMMMSKQVKIAEENSQSSQLPLQSKQNPKSLYKISKRPVTTKLINQQAPTKGEAMQRYREAYSKLYKQQPAVKKIDVPIVLNPVTVKAFPSWQDFKLTGDLANGMTAYTEDIQHRRKSRIAPEPDDVDY